MNNQPSLRIALINEYFPPFTPGGAEWSMIELGKSLIANEYKVIIITIKFDESASEEIFDGINVYRIKIPGVKIKDHNNPSIKHSIIRNIWIYLFFSLKIRKILYRENINVVHSQNTFSIIPSYLASLNSEIRTILTIRDYNNICTNALCPYSFEAQKCDCTFQKYLMNFHKSYKQYQASSSHLRELLLFIRSVGNNIDLRFRKKVIKKYSRVIFVSNSIMKIHHLAGVSSPEQSKVIYNIPPSTQPITQEKLIALNEKFINKNKRMILYVGKMSFGKGTQFLIDAVPSIISKVSNIIFVFIGKGYNNYSSPKGYEDYYYFLPPTDNSQILSLMNLATLIVIPSIWQEPLSRILLEAMSLGKPIVATNVGGTPEVIIDNVTGFLVEPKNSESLAKKIITLFEDKELSKNIAENCKILLNKSFDKNKIITQMIEVYQGAC